MNRTRTRIRTRIVQFLETKCTRITEETSIIPHTSIRHRDPNRNSSGVVLLQGGAQWPPYSVRDEADVARRYFVLESGEEGPAATLSRSQSQSPASSSALTPLPHRIGYRLGDRTCYFLTQQLPRVLRGAHTFCQTLFTGMSIS